MRQVGIVVSIQDGYASALVAKTSMCGENCGACKGGCKPGKQKVTARIACADSLQIGDKVALELESGKVLSLAALLYLLPIAGLFAAYFVSDFYFHSEPISIVSALAAAIFLFFFVKLLDNSLKNSKKCEIRITKVLR